VIKINYKKIDFSKNLSNKKGFSILSSRKIIDDLIESLKINLKKNNLNLKNIGTFRVIKKHERIGINPKTKEKFIVKPRYSISFKVSKKLLKLINI
jgi:nucleoid DNA-binding protein